VGNRANKAGRITPVGGGPAGVSTSHFGLVDESGDRAGDGGHIDWVELYPDRLGFCDPWDGYYST
jgi:hypothetical protein